MLGLDDFVALLVGLGEGDDVEAVFFYDDTINALPIGVLQFELGDVLSEWWTFLLSLDELSELEFLEVVVVIVVFDAICVIIFVVQFNPDSAELLRSRGVNV